MPMSETERLKKVVKEAIHQLRDRGVTESEIYNLLIDKRPKISRLIITPRKRLILSDYGVEVKMEPLHKAVYILFLRHPEGIRIKEISDYQEELSDIYWSFKLTTEAKKKIQKSIENVTDPLNHSIHEKIARINGVFAKLLDPETARYYQIHGEKGEKKAIKLSSGMVEFAPSEKG